MSKPAFGTSPNLQVESGRNWLVLHEESSLFPSPQALAKKVGEKQEGCSTPGDPSAPHEAVETFAFTKLLLPLPVSRETNQKTSAGIF